MENKIYQKLNDEIEKIKFHHLTLLKLICEDDFKKNKINIYEMIVSFDLSKNDFRELSFLIANSKNKADFIENAIKINSHFHEDNLSYILKCFINSQVNKEQSEKLLKSFS